MLPSTYILIYNNHSITISFVFHMHGDIVQYKFITIYIVDIIKPLKSKHLNKRREGDQKQELMLNTVPESKRHTQQLNDRSNAADVNYT